MARPRVYADLPGRRARQLVGDLLLLAWVACWFLVAQRVHEVTLRLARPGEEIAAAGSGLADQLRRAGRAVEDTPFVGDHLEAPFAGAGDAAAGIAAAGTRQAEVAGQLADWLAVSVAVAPVLLAGLVYLPLRWRFVRRATAAQRHLDRGGDLDLLALRALTGQPVQRLTRVAEDPASAWRRGEPEVLRALALLELRELGLRPPLVTPGAGPAWPGPQPPARRPAG